MWETVLIVGLASWRIANMLVDEDGPFDIFERLRQAAGLRPGEVNGFLPELLSCIWCTSVWTTVLVFLLWVIEPVGVMILAAMAIPPIVHRITQ